MLAAVTLDLLEARWSGSSRFPEMLRGRGRRGGGGSQRGSGSGGGVWGGDVEEEENE